MAPNKPHDPRWSNVINAHLAIRLYRKLNNWRMVGAEMARLEGRPVPYRDNSVRNAVSQYRAGIRDFIPKMGTE